MNIHSAYILNQIFINDVLNLLFYKNIRKIVICFRCCVLSLISLWLWLVGSNLVQTHNLDLKFFTPGPNDEEISLKEEAMEK